MSDPLDKYRRPQGQPAEEEDPDLSTPDGKTYLAYRAGKKPRRLTVRRRREAHRAPAYGYLIDVMWDGDAGKNIALVFSHSTIMLRGKNLQDLARQLAGESVVFIQEFDGARWENPAAEEPIIESIEYTSRITGSLGATEDQATK